MCEQWTKTAGERGSKPCLQFTHFRAQRVKKCVALCDSQKLLDWALKHIKALSGIGGKQQMYIQHRPFCIVKTPSPAPSVSQLWNRPTNISGKKETYAQVRHIYSWPSLPGRSAAKLQGFAPAQHLHHMDALLQSNDVSLCLPPFSL